MYLEYKTYLQDYIKNTPSTSPLFAKTVAQSLKLQYTLDKNRAYELAIDSLNEFAQPVELEELDKLGIVVFYRQKETVFGKTKPPMEEIITQLCTKDDDDVIGYLGGASLFHQMGLCSLMPNQKTIVTNRYDFPLCGTLLSLVKPQTTISKEIVKYLQFLDVVSELKKYYVDSEYPKVILKRAINSANLDKKLLFSLIEKYYITSLIYEIEDILKERTHDTTRR